MPRSGAGAAASVERFFQLSLLGLVASGYLAVAGSGYLDAPTVVLTAAGLLLRAAAVLGLARVEIPERVATLLTLGYTGFFFLDYFLLSRDFLTATVHLVFYVAVMKVLTAKTDRDLLFTAAIALLELVSAAILSVNLNFFLFLAAFLLCAMAALTSGEMRRSMRRARVTARGAVRRFHPRLATLSILVTAGILCLTAGLFFLLPRTADAAFARLIRHRIYLPGFSNQVTLGEIGEIKNSSRPVMHIRVYSRETPGGLKWRGGALTAFDGKRWSNPDPRVETVPVEGGHAELRSPRRPEPGRKGLNYQVALDLFDTDALFFVGTPETVDLRRAVLLRTGTGSYRLAGATPPGFRYDAYSLLERPPEAVPPVALAPALSDLERARYLQLPPLDPRIPELARAMAPPSGSALEQARGVERRLRRDYGYSLELPQVEPPDPLAYFLFTRKQGYCEYFASAMTVMLRTLGVPARLATGFQSGTFNPISELWVVRSSDAHSWVEAWIPGYGWTTFDPTPPDPRPPQWALVARLGMYLDAAETFWRDWVVSYDVGRQGSLADRMEQGARRAGIRWFDSFTGFGTTWKARVSGFARAFGVRILVVVGLALWAWLLGPPLLRLARMRRRVRRARLGQASPADATLLYQRMLHLLKRRGYQKPAWFTPYEFAATLPRTEFGAIVVEFTETYNALRFGGRTEAAPRLSALLERLERKQG